MKIYIVQGSKLNSKLNSIEKYCYIGSNVDKAIKLKKKVPKDLESLDYSEVFHKIQYDYRDKYINFIDKFERQNNDKWWATRLAGKNTRASSFYLRFAHTKLVEHIIDNERQKETKSIVFFIEEKCTYLALSSSLKNDFQSYKTINLENYDWIIKIIRGYIRRLACFFKYAKDQYKLKSHFSSLKPCKKKYNELTFVFTFIDSRSFREKGYHEHFLGKALGDEPKNLIIVPVFIKANKKELLLFRSWLQDNKFHVLHPISIVGATKLLIWSLKGLVQTWKKSQNVSFEGIEVKDIINYERIEEWSDFNLTRNIFSELGKQIIKFNAEKMKVIYPFENQIWERELLNSINSQDNVIVHAIQNAPSPYLYMQHYFCKEFKNEFPRPDKLFVNGQVSYENLKEFFENIVIDGSKRTVIKNLKDSNNVEKQNNIFLGCSISTKETKALIAFVHSSLAGQFHYNVSILPHPLCSLDFKSFLRKINAPENFKIVSNLEECMKKNQFLVFDCSTIGLEGLLNGLTPINVFQTYSLHINPSEYDLKYTKKVFSKESFLNVISQPQLSQIDLEKGKEVALKYYNFNVE